MTYKKLLAVRQQMVREFAAARALNMTAVDRGANELITYIETGLEFVLQLLGWKAGRRAS